MEDLRDFLPRALDAKHGAPFLPQSSLLPGLKPGPLKLAALTAVASSSATVEFRVIKLASVWS